MAVDFISTLRSFNRKERFFLIGQVLGNENFTLSTEFRKILEQKIGLEIPQDAFVAMDYHLDWIYASLYCAEKERTDFIAENPNRKLNSNQEDVDLLVAFSQNSVYHLILIEAKAESGWTNKQFLSKTERLKYVFGTDQVRWQNIKPYFLITSPRKPQNLALECLPVYLRRTIDDLWFRLTIPDKLIKITRCNNLGTADTNGTMWKVERT